MPRYRALVEYDGTAYFGFQRQREEQPTIQAELESALAQVVHRPVTIIGAGRTDSGVHALGQVITFDIEWRHGDEALQRAFNANLPADIAILQLNQVTSTFHPRFDARRRTYAYYVYNATVPSPLCRHRSWHVARPLDLERMNQAAMHLVGTHDFATFGHPPQGEKCVREVFTASWQRPKDRLLVFTITANAFLYRMVRSLVGSLKLVGEGTWTVEEFADALQARDRSRAGMPAPAHGLYLVKVTYDMKEITD